jgi:hypothetical protein
MSRYALAIQTGMTCRLILDLEKQQIIDVQ